MKFLNKLYIKYFYNQYRRIHSTTQTHTIQMLNKFQVTGTSFNNTGIFPLWKLIVMICLLSSHLQSLQAQQIFPVQVNGTILPPYSALLSDYAGPRASDLTYTLTLNDPIELSRNVYFRITIISNGQEIMASNPNFIPPPLQLLQFTPTTITGIELASYFLPNNLISLNGGSPSNALPEGFNQICIEVMDFERQIPISQQICRGGFVRRLEPPLLSKPECHQAVQVAPSQPILFRWVPRHLGLPNTPMLVEYEFTLAELLPGIVDPNDGFRSAIQIFQTTITTPTLIYGETSPPLQNGKTYAWRIRVKDQQGSNLFDNAGYSQICSFVYLEDQTLTSSDIATSSCTPFNTQFRLPQNAGFTGELIDHGDIIKLGFFDLEVLQAFNTGNGYMGMGQVYVSFLKAYVKVIFEGVKVNKNRRAYEVGEAKAVGDLVFINSNSLNLRNIRKELNLELVLELRQMLRSPIEKKRRVSNRDESDEVPIGLPLIMDKTDERGSPLPEIAIMDMRFTVREAHLTALSWLPSKNPERPVVFGGTAIGFTPSGINSRGSLSLFSATHMRLKNNDKIHLKPNTYNTVGTKMRINCEGFEVFNLEGDYYFNQQIVHSSNAPSEQLSVPFSTQADHLYHFVAGIGKMPPFQFANLPDQTFEMGETFADYSRRDKLANSKFINNFRNDFQQSADWTGFTFKKSKTLFNLSISKKDFRKYLEGGETPIINELKEILELSGDPDISFNGLKIKGIQTSLSTSKGEYYRLIFDPNQSSVKIGNRRFPINHLKVLFVTPYNKYFRAEDVGFGLEVIGNEGEKIDISIWSSKNETTNKMELNRIKVEGLDADYLKAHNIEE